jgi:hypothetical protein
MAAKILVVMMESYGPGDFISGSTPYITNTLMAHYAWTPMVGIGHYSASSYVTLFSGRNVHSAKLPPGFTVDNPDYVATGGVYPGDSTDSSALNGTAPLVTTIFDLLHTAGKTYKGYYDQSFASYRDVLSTFPRLSSSPVSLPTSQASSGSVSGTGTLTALIADLDTANPDFAYVYPSNAHNMHDGGGSALGQGDTWLAAFIPAVQATTWYANGGTILIWWDEVDGWHGSNTDEAFWIPSGGDSRNGGSGGPVCMIGVSLATVGKGALGVSTSTAGALATICAAYGFTPPATAAYAVAVSGLFGTAAPTPPPGSPPIPNAPVTVGALLFDDEFPGSSLDTTKWANTWSGPTMNGVATSAGNVAVSGGVCTLTLSDSSHGALIHTDPSFVSPGFQFTDGYLEFGAYFDGQAWDAVWTDGQTWPQDGEIDVAEWLGAMTSNYHSGGPSHSGTDVPDNGLNETGYFGGWHTFGVERHAGSAGVNGQNKIWWDGNLIRTYTTYDQGAPQYIIANKGAGTVGSKLMLKYVRVWALTGGGTGPTPPTATTNPASLVTSAAATLNGTVNPDGADTTVTFNYGTTAAYGSTTSGHDAGAGTSAVGASAAISGLSAGTTYHYQVVATSSAGTANGADHTFTTSAVVSVPVVQTDAPSAITATTATLNGTFNPEGAATNAFFRWSLANTFPSIGVLDDFTRTNENPLSDGGNWSTPNPAIDTIKLVSDKAVPNAAGAGAGIAWWNVSTFTETDVWGVVADITNYPILLACLTHPTGLDVAGYLLRVEATQMYLSHLVAIEGTSHLLTGLSIANGDSVGMRVQGGTIAVYHKPSAGSWTLLGTFADTSYSSGYIGLGFVGSLSTGAWSQFGGGAVAPTFASTSSPIAIGSGSSPLAETYAITGLTPGAHYFVQAYATNANGTTYGQGVDLQAIQTGAATAPTVFNGVTNIGSTTATLTGTVNPNGLDTTVHFEYGLTSSYGFTTATQDIGAGVNPVSVTQDISGLYVVTTYHYRIVATNSAGTSA